MEMKRVHEDFPEEHSQYQQEAEYLFPVDRDLQSLTCVPPTIGTVASPGSCTSIGCTAKDLTYLSCELVPEAGQCFTCNCGDIINVKVRCMIRNDTGSDRRVAWIIGTLEQTGQCPNAGATISNSCPVGLCSDATVLQPGVPQDTLFGKTLPWVCGSTVKLTNVILGSGPTSSTCASYTRCNSFGPKCEKVAEFKVDTPLGPPSPAVVCKGGSSLNHVVSYTISGGKPGYTTTITCTSPGYAPVVETRSVTGTFSKEIANCNGNITVSIKDNSTCAARSQSVVAPKCCFNNLSCKALPPVGTFNGCDASQVTVPNRDLTSVFNFNPEACNATVTSFSSSTVYSPNSTAVCPPRGVNVTRTFTAVPVFSNGQPDTANTKTCSESWSVISQTPPTIVSGPDETVECSAVNFPGDQRAKATATAQCGTPTVTQTTKSDVDTPSNCAAVKTVTLTLTATDKCGRTASDDQIFTYKDTTPPVFSGVCSGSLDPITLTCASNLIPEQINCPATDACSFTTVTRQCCSEGNKLKRTWTVKDRCGNVGLNKTQYVQFGPSTC